jgi:hypothetical protein
VFYILFALCRSFYCLCVNVYCTTATQLQLTNISYYFCHLSPLEQHALSSATDELCCGKRYLVSINRIILSLQNTNVDDGTGFINDLPLLKSEYQIFVLYFCMNNLYELLKSSHLIAVFNSTKINQWKTRWNYCA